MTDEEKEALRNFKSEYETCDHYSSDLIIELDDAEIILNLIEKQSKEIEELKEENRIQRKQLNDVFDRGWIHKDKIKAKIEEIDKEIKAKRELARKPMDRVTGRLLTDGIVELEKTKKVLQSLLEEKE